jgi:hypothetical protein
MLSQVQWGELTIHHSYHNDGVGVELLAQLPLCGRNLETGSDRAA